MAAFKGADTLTAHAVIATPTAQIAAFQNASRRTVTLQNLGANDVYIGGETVSTAQGFKLPANKQITLEMSGEVWVVTIATNEELRVLEEADQ